MNMTESSGLTTLVVEVLKVGTGQKIAFTFMRDGHERYCINATHSDFMKGVKVGDKLLLKGAWSEAVLDFFECAHVAHA